MHVHVAELKPGRTWFTSMHGVHLHVYVLWYHIHTYMYTYIHTYTHTHIHTYKHTVHCTYTHTYKHIFEPGSVHVGTVPHTIVFIKSNPPPHGVHDALWLFKDLLLHKVVIATYGGRDTEIWCHLIGQRSGEVEWYRRKQTINGGSQDNVPFMISWSFILRVCTSRWVATALLLLLTWWMERTAGVRWRESDEVSEREKEKGHRKGSRVQVDRHSIKYVHVSMVIMKYMYTVISWMHAYLPHCLQKQHHHLPGISPCWYAQSQHWRKRERRRGWGRDKRLSEGHDKYSSFSTHGDTHYK